MLEKFTGKEELNEQLKELKSIMEDIIHDQKKTQESLRNDLAVINQSIQRIENNKDSIIASLKRDMEDITKAKEELMRSATALKDMQAVLYNQVYGRLDNALKTHINSLKSTTEEFEGLKPEVKNTMQLLSNVKEEVNRLQELSKTIKLQDTQLVEYVRNFQKLDDEKLRLMRQVDKLQEIIARQRRGDVRRLTY